MKTVWIDRVCHQHANNWGTGRPVPYYDYTIHIVDGDGERTPDNTVHSISGRDYRTSQSDQMAVSEAERLAGLIGAEVKKAWEEGEINFRVAMYLPITASTPEEAEAKFRDMFNIHHSRARVHVEEGS